MTSEIFECQSSQDFLQLSLRMKRRRPMSIRELSRRLNYASDRAFGMALQGQRPMSADMLDRLCAYLKLTAKEEAFVRLLAKRERAQRSNRAEILTELDRELNRFRKGSKPYETLSEGALNQMESWFYFPLVRLLRFAKRPMLLSEIATAFENRIPSVVLSSALSILQTLGIVFERDDQQYEAYGEDRYLISSFDIPSQSIRRAHKNQLKRAETALDEQSVLERDFISKTLVIPEGRVEDSKKRIRETLEDLSDELLALGDDKTAAHIYQLSIQFYRQAKVPSKGN